MSVDNLESRYHLRHRTRGVVGLRLQTWVRCADELGRGKLNIDGLVLMWRFGVLHSARRGDSMEPLTTDYEF